MQQPIMHKRRQTEEDFHFQLIKGKIAEQIFILMLGRSKKYTIIPFGYESIIPELAQHLDYNARRETFETIRNAPDFAVISHDKQSVSLVEVKYRSRLDADELKMIAAKIHEKWKIAKIFVATPKGFYMGDCLDVILNGSIKPLSEEEVGYDVQEVYIKFLDRFMHEII